MTEPEGYRWRTSHVTASSCIAHNFQQPENQWPADHALFGGIQEVTVQSADRSPSLEPIVDFKAFSDWTKLVRVITTVPRAVHIFQSLQKTC